MTNRLRSITTFTNVCHALRTGELEVFPVLLEESRAVRAIPHRSWDGGQAPQILFRGKPCLKPQEFLKRIAIKH
jgi:hypothetical protein